MADSALRPDSVRANPEPAPADSFRHSRRALLGAMAVVPTLALPALPAMASTGGLAAALAAWKHADREADRFREAVFEPAHPAWRAQINAIPHVGSEFTDITGLKHPMSTREEWAVMMARKELASKKSGTPTTVTIGTIARKSLTALTGVRPKRRGSPRPTALIRFLITHYRQPILVDTKREHMADFREFDRWHATRFSSRKG